MIDRTLRWFFFTLVGLLIATCARMAAGQSNTWIQLSPTATTRWNAFPANGCSATTSSAGPMFREYSGPALGGGYLFYFGGGHTSSGGYAGNDVDLYTIATNQWVPDYPNPQPQCAPAVCCAGNGGSGCDNFPVGGSCVSVPYNSSCLQGSCTIIGGSQASKPAFRCSNAVSQLCAQDSDCTGGTCTIGIPTPGSVCTTCRPYTAHQYQRAVWNQARGAFLVYTEQGTWEWTPSFRSWRWLGPPPRRERRPERPCAVLG